MFTIAFWTIINIYQSILAEPIVVDRVIAVVNGEAILASELQTSLAIQRLTKAKGEFRDLSNVQKNAVLEKMIDEKILLQRAKLLNLSVNSEMILGIIEDIAKNQELTVDKLRKKLKNAGINFEDFKTKLETDVLLSRLRDKELDQKLYVSDTEAENFLSTEVEFNLSSGEIAIMHLKVPFNDEIGKAGSSEVAQKILVSLIENKSANFEDRKFGGYEFEEWGWRKYDRIPELFLNHVISLEPGNYSEVIESKSGFHILYVVDRRSTLIQDKIVRYRAKHILKRVDDERNDQEAFESLKEIKKRVLAGERFEYFAKRFSEDEKSAENDGDLGWAYQGDYVPSFEREAIKLQIGEISDPVRTPYGYHLIMITDRVQEKVSAERKLTLAKNLIREKRVRDVVREWIADMRANSFIDKKI
ncbi:peptidylprolyl isomerase [Betaproteobacteria bacterium]|nr:peptidylprolyl isomerase [Betaproteobacteria bacterium]